MPSDFPKSCYVVDDDQPFRESIIALVSAAGYACRGFASGAEFLAAASGLSPGTVLLDLRMPGVNGLDLLEGAGEQLEQFAVVMISGHGHIERAVRSIRAGAIEFIEKPFDPEQLLALLEAANDGLALKIVQSTERREAQAKVGTLSPRELEVLRLLLTGAPNKVVARTFNLSVRTVEMHRAHMLAKLEARSTAYALHIAMLANVPPW